MSDTVENWKWIPDHEGRYAVSDKGRVYSYVTDRFLRPGAMNGGHMSVALGRGNSRCVHELVLTTFVGPKPEGCEGRHLNGVQDDNRLGNLCWATRARNTQDRKWHSGGLNQKLTVSDVREIKAALSRGELQVTLADRFNVSRSLICNIANNRVHKDV